MELKENKICVFKPYIGSKYTRKVLFVGRAPSTVGETIIEVSQKNHFDESGGLPEGKTMPSTIFRGSMLPKTKNEVQSVEVKYGE